MLVEIYNVDRLQARIHGPVPAELRTDANLVSRSLSPVLLILEYGWVAMLWLLHQMQQVQVRVGDEAVQVSHRARVLVQHPPRQNTHRDLSLEFSLLVVRVFTANLLTTKGLRSSEFGPPPDSCHVVHICVLRRVG